MAHTLATNGCFCDLDAAAVTYYALVADLFIFSAVALPVLARSEDLFTEQTVFFRL